MRGDRIPLNSRDEHIPWHLFRLNDRADLRSAARILVALERCGHALDWSYDEFPGAFYRSRDNCLAVPLPAWGTTPNDLLGLRPLIDAIRPRSGFIRELWVIPVHWDPTVGPSPKTVLELQELLAKHVALPRFAKASDVLAKQLTDL